MTLYRDVPTGPFPVWPSFVGERINDVLYPPNIEQQWGADDLRALGLWRDDMIAPAEAVPDGKAVSSRTVERIGGVVTFVNALMDAPFPTADQVKAEAFQRIVTLCPEWKQRNLTAQAVILAKQIADGEALTVEQQAAWDAGQSIWQQIAAIRAKSDEIEAMDPIPRDFSNDGYWSA